MKVKEIVGAEAESKDYEKAYNRLKGALYDEWVYRDIEDSCNCEYIIDQKLESGEITMEEAESDTPQCQYCVVMDVFEEYGAESFGAELESGEAALRIVISEGQLSVYHDASNNLLMRRPIYAGEWDKIRASLNGAESFGAEERMFIVKEYPHTITKEQHDEIIKLLDEHDPNENIYYVRYGDTMRIITPHGPLKASFLPTFSAESDQFPSLHYGDYDSDAQEKYQEFVEEWDGDDEPPSIEEWIEELDEYDRRLQEYEGTEEYQRAMDDTLGAEVLGYPHSMSDRQKHRIRKLGGRIDKAMTRSEASKYIKSLMAMPLHAESTDCSVCEGWGWNEELDRVCDADGCIGGWIVPKKPSLLERGLELGAGMGMGMAGVAILFGLVGGTVGFATEEIKKRRD